MGTYFDFPVYADEEMKDIKAKHLGNFDSHVVDMGTGASHDGILNVATNGKYEDHKDPLHNLLYDHIQRPFQ